MNLPSCWVALASVLSRKMRMIRMGKGVVIPYPHVYLFAIIALLWKKEMRMELGENR
jgi:hypothetical protein